MKNEVLHHICANVVIIDSSTSVTEGGKAHPFQTGDRCFKQLRAINTSLGALPSSLTFRLDPPGDQADKRLTELTSGAQNKPTPTS
jgi:hypothetical protein